MTKEYHLIRELREQPEVARRSLSQADAQLAELARRYTSRAPGHG